jgi:hypothetical protein
MTILLFYVTLNSSGYTLEKEVCKRAFLMSVNTGVILLRFLL